MLTETEHDQEDEASRLCVAVSEHIVQGGEEESRVEGQEGRVGDNGSRPGHCVFVFAGEVALQGGKVQRRTSSLVLWEGGAGSGRSRERCPLYTIMALFPVRAHLET
jgi:hypothetical protein